MTIVEIARAKINLALHVRARTADGYHALETLFAFVADGDTLSIADADVPSFAVTGPFAASLAGEGDNLVLRAERLFRERIADVPPQWITLDKHLPVASGIGGGSADAAATLRALARRVEIATDDPRLFDCARELGSDVSACLASHTAIGTGRGDALTPVDGLAGTAILLVNPGVAVSTAKVFAAWDGVDRGPLPAGDATTIARVGRNDLEPPALALAPSIADALASLAAQPGAWLTRMSGSGATCFALFDTQAHAHAAAQAIAAAHPDWWVQPSVLT